MCILYDHIVIVHSIRQSRPYSKLKRWKIDEIAKKYAPTKFLEDNPEYKVVHPDKKVPRVHYRPKRGAPDNNKLGYHSYRYFNLFE